MSPPGAASSAASTTLVLAFLLPGSVPAETSPYTRAAIAGEYHYDPAAHEAKPVEPAPPPAPTVEVAPAGRPRPRVADPDEHISEGTLVLVPAGVAALDGQGTFVLPKMTVPGAKPKQPAALPQFYINRGVKNVGNGSMFETPAARRERLLNKYYTPFEQKFNKLLLNRIGAWGARDESIYYSSEQLNDIAYLIDLSLAAGTESPEEQKKIRAEYFRALAEKPR